MYLSIYLFIYVYIYLSIYLFIYLYIYLSIYLFIKPTHWIHTLYKHWLADIHFPIRLMD